MRLLFEERILKAPRLNRKVRLINAPAISPPPPAKDIERNEAPKGEESELNKSSLDTLRPEDSFRALQGETSLNDAMNSGEMETAAGFDYEGEAQEIISSAQQEADELIAQAHLKIELLKAEIEEEATKAKEDGYQTGYEEGFVKGEKKAEEEYTQKLAEVESKRREAETLKERAEEEKDRIIKEAEEERIERIFQSEEEILKLAFEIAEKIIRKQLLRSPEDWLGMVREATERIAGARELTVRVSAQDETYFKDHLHEIQRILSEAPQVKIVVDPSLEPGDLILQSDLGQIDARIKQQLDKMLHSLSDKAGE